MQASTVIWCVLESTKELERMTTGVLLKSRTPVAGILMTFNSVVHPARHLSLIIALSAAEGAVEYLLRDAQTIRT